MFRRRQEIRKVGEGENPFLLTFSDFMASLLAIFILVLIVTLIELEKKKDALKRQQQEITLAKEDLLRSLEDIQSVQGTIVQSLQGVNQREHALSGMLEGIKQSLSRKGVSVVIAENGSVLRIPEEQLQFALGKYDIPRAQSLPATEIGRALLEALSVEQNRRMLDTVFLEGHTDSVPNSREMGNWGLSTYRAIGLWNFWTESPGELAELKSLKTLPTDTETPSKLLISVSGYADTRSTHGAVNRAELRSERSEDRRIDIRFTLVSSEKQSLQDLQKNLKQMRQKTDSLIDKLRSPTHAP